MRRKSRRNCLISGDKGHMQRRTGRIGANVQPLLAAIFTIVPLLLSAQNNTQLGTAGTRFWTGFMQNGFAAQSLKVNVMGAVGTTGTVSIPLAAWSVSYVIPANGVASVTLPNSAENTGSEMALPKGVLIEASANVNVLISSFQNFTLDNSQILPETSLGDRYRVDAYHGVPGFNNLHKSELLIVATQDGTQIQITPSVATLGGHAANVPFTITLQAGQTYQIQAAFDNLDLTGTLIEATASSGSCRPFAVYGGSMCANIPSQACSACDHIFEQLFPLNTWGTKFFTVPVNGVNGSSYRVLAHENNTAVTIGGNFVSTLNAGQKYEVNGVNTPVCIETSRPASVTQLLEGIACAGSGDPSMVILSPAERFSTQATFITPTSPQLSQHSVSIVVPNASVGQVAVDGSAINPTLFQSYNGCNTHKHVKLPITAGVHSVQAANGFQLYMFGLGAGESYAASVHDIGTPPVEQDSLICGDETITLNCPGPWTNIAWYAESDPDEILATTPGFTITPVQTDTYVVTGSLGVNGCPQSYSYHVGMPLTIPTEATVNGANTATICQYEQVQLGLDPPPDPAWFNIAWSPSGSLDDPTRSDPIASPLVSTWYTVEVTSPTGCGSTIDSVYVQVSPGSILELNTSVSNDTICLGGQTNLTSQAIRVVAQDQFNSAPSAIWSSIQGGSVANTCGSVSGNALYFNAAGQRSAQTVGLNATNGHQVRFQLKIANGTAPCDDADPGENVVLEYSTTNGFSWSLMATYNENNHPSFTPIQATIPAAAQTANTMFRIRQLANSGLGHDNWAIDNFTVTRIDDNWLSYQWQPSGSVSNATAGSTNATPIATGWFVLNGTDPTAGCVYQDSVHVVVMPAFALDVTPDTLLCAIAGIQLNAAPITPVQATYTWTPNNGTLSNANTANPIATPQATTIYTVNATSQHGCTTSEQVQITVGQLLNLSVSASDTSICQGQQVQLNASASGGTDLTYNWSNGSSLSNASIAAPIASPGATTTYSCTVSESSGCSLTESVTITVSTGYTANAGNDLSLCSALGHQLSVQHNVPNPSYQWSPAANLNAANIQSPTILFDGSATYTVTITDQNGCSVTDQITITKYFEGVPSQASVSVCANTPPLLSAPAPAVSYLWSTGQTTSSITAMTGGPHTVTMTNSAGCQVSTTFNVVLMAIPVVELGSDVTLCGANSHVLDAGNDGTTYAWNTGGTGQTLVVTNSGNYSVSVTNANGCMNNDAVQVQFNALPTDVLQDVTTCETSPPTLNAGNPGSAYLWSTGATTQSIVPTATGTYSVSITSPQDCNATYDVYVDLVQQIHVDLGNDTTLCQGQQVILNAGNPGATYQWSNMSTAASIVANSTGTYGVTVSNGYCTASDAIDVQVDPLPTDELVDAVDCIGESIILNAGNNGSDHIWNTGESTATIEVTTPGTYSVSITNQSGCSATYDASVQFVQPPIVQLGNDTVLCSGQILVLDAGPTPQGMYLWNTGATTRTIAVSTAGTYGVSVSNGYCSREDQITVLFNPAPHRIQDRQHQFCLDDEPYHVTLDAGNTGSQYQWSTGDTTRSIEATEYGSFTVIITNEYGCSLTDSVQVIEFCPSTIFLPNTFTPNGDGMNDIFLPVGNNIASLKLMIFDRWGTMIFQSTDPTIGWDGTYRGEFVTDDIYVWRINYRFYEDRNGKLGMEKEMTGHIQVLR